MPVNSLTHTPTLSVKSGNPLTAPADVLIVATTSDDKVTVIGDLINKAAANKIVKALHSLGATGAAEEIVKIPGSGISVAPLIIAVGLGSMKDGVTEERLRRSAGAATRAAAGNKRVVIALPATYAVAAGAILEGAALGSYSFTDHRHSTLNKQKSPVKSVALFASGARGAEYKAAVERARVVAHNVSFARDLINTSPLQLPPAELATRAKEFLKGSSVKVTVLDDKQLKDQGYGGITAVGQGSARGPRLVRMEYKPRNARKHVALVGKGITFDTGGISIKPAPGMHAMKADMSGAAAVIATIRTVAELELPIAVTAYAACAENMPGGGAQRPGDIISIYGGKTVEVLNTDAEGRLVMADALVRVGEDDADVVLDISTLTGAMVVALGHNTAGVMGDEAVREGVKHAADRVGEEFWPMPMPAELRAPMDSMHADIANIGIREGGALSAGLFLKEFVPNGLPWAHLDIAGPAFHEQAPFGYTAKGGVGFGVRTMLAFIEDVESGSVSLP
jgi:leucyl aminopeptidase